MAKAHSYSFSQLGDNLVIDYTLEEGRSQHRYGIPLFDLRQEHGESDVMIDLQDKRWMTIELLYDLVSEINHILPDNNINWFDTLFILEKEEAIRGIQAEQRTEHVEEGTDSTNTLFQRTIDSIGLRKNKANDQELNDSVRRVVQEKMSNRGLLPLR